jgi:nucleoside-diphosphate-sugar epimerase
MPEEPIMNTQPSNRGTARKFLVTGAQGFIGAWIVKTLVERGDEPVVFDLSKESRRLQAIMTAEELARVTFIEGDITELAPLERAVAENGITHIIHLAGLQIPLCAADPIRGAKVNVIGTLNVFEVARRRPDLVKRIAYASSAAVYGPAEAYEGGRVAENARLLPATHYGVFKQCNEGNAAVYFRDAGISSAGLRPLTLYGVGRDFGLTSGPTKAIKAAIVGRPYTIKFTGATNMPYIRDCAEIFIRCAEMELPGARVYAVRGVVIDMAEFIKTLEALEPRARGLVRAEGPHLPIAADLDDSALRRDLGEVPMTPLEEGIRETATIFDRLQREGRLDTQDLEV